MKKYFLVYRMNRPSHIGDTFIFWEQFQCPQNNKKSTEYWKNKTQIAVGKEFSSKYTKLKDHNQRNKKKY